MFHCLCLSIHKAVAAFPLTEQILVPGQHRQALMRPQQISIYILAAASSSLRVFAVGRPLREGIIADCKKEDLARLL